MESAYRRPGIGGSPDRDLLVHTIDYNPNEHFSIHSFVWSDFYDSRDTLKTTAFEITEVVIQPMLRIDPGHGIGLHVSYVRWPQLLRLEYSPFVNSQITNGRVVRYRGSSPGSNSVARFEWMGALISGTTNERKRARVADVRICMS